MRCLVEINETRIYVRVMLTDVYDWNETTWPQQKLKEKKSGNNVFKFLHKSM